jgi:hypothetical protein
MGIERGWRTAGIVLLIAAAAGCTGAPRGRPLPTTRVEKGPGTLSDARKFLQGRWTLESFEVRPPGKAPIAVKGSGTLDYDDFGNLRMELRADQATSDALRAAGIDMREGVVSTEGRTVIDLQHKTLTYVLEGQPPASTGPLAPSRPRHWEVTGDTLTLTTKDDAGAPLSIGRWKRNP